MAVKMVFLLPAAASRRQFQIYNSVDAIAMGRKAEPFVL